MNCGEKSPAIQFMKGEAMQLDEQEWSSPYSLVDTFRMANPNAKDVGTFNGFKEPGKAKIDYVFVSPKLKTISAEIIRTQRDGRYPTDHFPIDAVIAWHTVVGNKVDVSERPKLRFFSFREKTRVKGGIRRGTHPMTPLPQGGKGEK